MTTIQQFYTVKEAAQICGVCDSRIRQICLQLQIGQLVGPVKLLTERELRQIQNLPDGRKKTKSA